MARPEPYTEGDLHLLQSRAPSLDKSQLLSQCAGGRATKGNKRNTVASTLDKSGDVLLPLELALDWLDDFDILSLPVGLAPISTINDEM